MSLKKLKSELYLAPDLPEFVVGDEKRLMQTVLNVVGNAVKFTKEGSIFVRVTVDGSQLQSDTHLMDFETSRSDQHCYVRVEVQNCYGICVIFLGLNLLLYFESVLCFGRTLFRRMNCV